MREEASNTEVEAVKLVTGYLKHLTSLSVGSIVVVVTFVEKIAAQPHWKLLAGISVVGFLVCILGCLIGNGILVFRAEGGDFSETKGAAETAEGVSLSAAFASFFVALLCLAAFGIRNLWIS